jgi:hypothetical protein
VYLVLLFILLVNVSINIFASPWIPCEGNFQLIDSLQLKVADNKKSSIDVDNKINILLQDLGSVKNNKLLGSSAKARRLEIINREIDRLFILKRESSFHALWSNNIYFEYSISEKTSCGFSIFSQAKNLMPKEHYASFFSKFNFLRSANHAMSCGIAAGMAHEIDLNASISYGYSWKSKKRRYFSYIEPSVTISKNQFSRIAFDFTNGIRFDNGIISISQTIYENNLNIVNSKFKHIFREKCSLVKEIECSQGVVCIEVGFSTTAYFKKHADADICVMFGMWYKS